MKSLQEKRQEGEKFPPRFRKKKVMATKKGGARRCGAIPEKRTSARSSEKGSKLTVKGRFWQARKRRDSKTGRGVPPAEARDIREPAGDEGGAGRKDVPAPGKRPSWSDFRTER